MHKTANKDETISRRIEILVAIAGREGSPTEFSLAEGLMQEGIGRVDADRLVVFVPLAFGRLVMARLGVHTSPDVLMTTDDGSRRVKRRLEHFPEFRVASQMARQQAGKRGFRVLVGMSSETVAVSNALDEGLDPKDMHLSPVVVLLPSASPIG